MIKNPNSSDELINEQLHHPGAILVQLCQK